MRSQTLFDLFTPGPAVVLAVLMLPVSALAFGGVGVGVGVGQAGISVTAGFAGVGAGVGQGAGGPAFSGAPGAGPGGAGPGGAGLRSGVSGAGQGLGGSSGAGVSEGGGPGGWGFGHAGPAGGGPGAAVGSGGGPGLGGGGNGYGGAADGALSVAVSSDGGPGGAVGPGGAPGGPGGGDHGSGGASASSGGPGGDGTGNPHSVNSASSADDTSSVTADSPAASDNASATSTSSSSSTGDGSGSNQPGANSWNAQTQDNSQAHSSYEQRRAAFLAQRALLETGMGPRRPDRGMAGAMRYARMHSDWSLSSILSHGQAPTSAQNQHLDRSFSSAVGTLPSLPKVGRSTAVARAERPDVRVYDPPISGPSLAATINPDRALFRKADPTPSGSTAAAAKSKQKTSPAAEKTMVVAHQSAPPLVMTDVYPIATGDQARSHDAMEFKTSLVSQGAAETPGIDAQDWSIIAQMPAERNAPLPTRGPILLIVFLSALSAYMFVRWTSVKCPHCGKLLEPVTTTCRRCGARLTLIRA
jgi:hypothetical protein